MQPVTGYQRGYYKAELAFEPGQLGRMRERIRAIVLSERRFKSTCVRALAEEHGKPRSADMARLPSKDDDKIVSSCKLGKGGGWARHGTDLTDKDDLRMKPCRT